MPNCLTVRSCVKKKSEKRGEKESPKENLRNKNGKIKSITERENRRRKKGCKPIKSILSIGIFDS